MRLLKHLAMPGWWVRRRFNRATRQAIEAAVRSAEAGHRGELRFVVEGGLPLMALLRGQTTRDRAVEVFSRLRVWDTEDNAGVLIYVQMADRRVEILADRAIAARVPQAEWDGLCRAMETAFAAGQWRAGAVAAINRAGLMLAEHFPARKAGINDLPDAPVLL